VFVHPWDRLLVQSFMGWLSGIRTRGGRHCDGLGIGGGKDSETRPCHRVKGFTPDLGDRVTRLSHTNITHGKLYVSLDSRADRLWVGLRFRGSVRKPDDLASVEGGEC